jgi:pimeloyl-ACP methyl ester carboxylesterase
MPSLKVNGIRIGYQERGLGEPLLLLMGLGAPGAVWEEHLKAYERHFRCIAMDNRGAGDSDKPQGPYSSAMMADDAAALLDSLHIGSARIAGISMGSAIAQELALRHPSKVRSMVLVSSWASCDSYLKELLEHFRLARCRLSPGAFTRLLQLWIYSQAYFNGHLPDLEQAKSAAVDNPMPQYAFDAQCQACMDHDSLARLGAIRQPCLLTVGDADIFTPPRLSQAMLSRLPDARLEIFPSAGHCHHWESLERFNKISAEFLLEH